MLFHSQKISKDRLDGMSEYAIKVHDYIHEHKDDFLQLLQRLVEEETPSYEPDCFDGIIKILKDEFEDVGYKVEHIPGKKTAGQLLCRPKSYQDQQSSQLVVGHIDTVWNKGILDEMPFKEEDNVISGPGIYDMKTGICMMVFALKAMADLGLKAKIQAVFLITTDEEIGSNESKELIIEEAKKAERTFVLEPSLDIDGKIKTRRKGVGHFELFLKGKPSHAGLAPEEGVSAILGLSHIVQELFKLNDPKKGVSVNVGTIEGGERTNVVAAKSKAAIDVRVPTAEDGKRIKNKIYNLQPEVQDIELEVKGDISRPPMEKTEENEKLWQLTQKLGKKIGLQLKEGMSGGGSDGNFTNQYSPTIDGLGAVGEGAHAYHEKIHLKETLDRAALFTLLLLHPSVQ
jgi:glutamate carboxypeptidase